jgi:hypothetical protein
MRIRSIAVLLVWWLLFAIDAHAEDYKLVLGEGVDVCNACKQNLERMTKHPACEREYSTELGLETPGWKPFDVSQHLGAMKQVLKYLATGNEFAKDDYVMGEEQYEARLRESVARGVQWVYLAQVDIDNDGQLDQVLRMPSKECNRRNQGYNLAYDTPIVVLKNDLSGLDRTKSDLAEQGLYKKAGQRGDPTYQMYGVFTYKGKTYFDRWNDVGREDESQRFTLSVYQSKAGKTKKLCQLKELFDQQGVTP